MAGLNVGDIVEITNVGLLHGQTVLNVFHYQTLVASTEASYAPAALLVAQQFDAGTNNPTLAILACQTPDYTLVKTRVQKIHPIRDIYVEALSGLVGTNNGISRTANTAAVVTKRGGLAGRKYIGGVHIGGVPESAAAGGLWDNTYKALLATVSTRLLEVYSLTGDAWEARPIIYNKATPAASLGIAATAVQPQARVMRRRTVGLGI